MEDLDVLFSLDIYFELIVSFLKVEVKFLEENEEVFLKL